MRAVIWQILLGIQGIHQEKEKEVYEFLEDDDDFEEFENDEVDYTDIIGDVEMDAGDDKKAEDFDRKLWHQDWEDEEQNDDFLE